MKMENLERILDFLRHEGLIEDYEVREGVFGNNEVSFMQTINTKEKCYNKWYKFEEGINQESFTIKTEIDDLWYWDKSEK